MVDLSQVTLDQLVIHKVGNKMRDEGVFVSPSLYQLTDANLEELLLKYFLSSFKNKVFQKFFHETDLHLNEMYMYASQIFIQTESFYEQSIHMLKHLYEKSTHPQIKSGEFYVAYFNDCRIGERSVEGIGIFKTETKETYLTVTQYATEFLLGSNRGINVKKLDKGCLILNDESPDGYRVLIVDAVNKGAQEAQYWKEEFLRLTQVEDEYYHTENCLDICQDFVENIYGQMHEADKKDQVLFMNQAIAYFDQHEVFDMEDFAREVIQEPQLVEQFKEHKELYELNQGLPPVDSFAISSPAVKQAKRKCRNLIKLDTEIEIKLKNPAVEIEQQFIERGFDEAKGMQFYKIYFNQEE